MSYSVLTRLWFQSDANIGEFGPTALRCATARGSAGSIDQGTWVQFDLQLSAGRIHAARFQAFACPHIVAIAGWLAGAAPGLALVAQLPETPRALRQRFEVPAEKLGRILVVEDAWCMTIRTAITVLGAGIG